VQEEDPSTKKGCSCWWKLWW